MIRVGILGFGGLGRAGAQVLASKAEMQLVAIADRGSFAYNPQGLDYSNFEPIPSENSIQQLLSYDIEGFFLALPNLPNNFMAEVAEQFIRSGWRGC